MSDRSIAKTIFIVGPTASGKSELAISLAHRLDGEIVNADSMQIYKNMDIGTAKLTADRRAGILHHLIDILDIGEDYSVSDYKAAAMDIMEDISNRGKTPIVCGGTGLYINALTSKMSFTSVKGDDELRRSLRKLAEENGAKVLYDRLKEVDPKLASRLHENDTKRVIRGIEVYTITGKPLSGQGIDFTAVEDETYDFVMLGLDWPRDTLYQRIDQRVDDMMENGLYQEARAIFATGMDLTHQSMMALGYRQLYDHFSGKCSLEEAVENIKRETRRYAKRQLTWFRRDLRIRWLKAKNVTQKELEQQALDIINS